MVSALVGGLWAYRFGETLAEENRRPLQFRETAMAFRTVLRTRTTLGFMLAMTFSDGAFFIYLGSGQPIIDEIYGHGNLFALIFGLMSVCIAIALVIASKLTDRLGAKVMASRATAGIVASGLVFVGVSLATDGRPSFGVWLVVATIGLALMTVITPTCMSLALEPMGAMAGTAAAVIGLVSQGGGALLAAVFDRQIDTTVTPMAVAFLLYGSIAAALVAWGPPSTSASRRLSLRASGSESAREGDRDERRILGRSRPPSWPRVCSTKERSWGEPAFGAAGEFVGMPNHKGGGLVVKLPRDRVSNLIESGDGQSFAPAGKVFKEWVLVQRHDEGHWHALLRESIDFVTAP